MGTTPIIYQTEFCFIFPNRRIFMDFTYNAIYYDYDSHPDNAELKSFSDFLTKINNFSSKYQCVFSCSGLLINLVHLIIITRKSLRVNSVYVIMIGITLSDLYTMFHVVYVFLDNIVSNYNWYECFQVCTEQECFKFHKYVFFVWRIWSINFERLNFQLYHNLCISLQFFLRYCDFAAIENF